MTDFELAAASLGGAVLLAVVLILDHARHDPTPPTRVVLADRKTWRREPGWFARHWGSLVGALVWIALALLLAPLILAA